ncbi:hemagglutinin repeat-containing protein [Variovorax sp. HJSM1_2]|uniref:hemagglutinin repeat-containing protein n=1 Tax=Variovorax sp. HJSM1_2 TaxID=3366263 RepID=UPI003BCBEECB
MNHNLFRVIWNAARGLRMVVQETASSVGKGRSRSGAPAASVVAVGLLFSGLLAPCARAQIIANPDVVGQLRATVLNAPNGVPLVNIQTPSAAGVSRNVYSRFDVQRQGVILNNSRGNTQTQLGGWVQGNPWLAHGSARVILNEVRSSAPSLLHGAVEVAGPRSEVVIANPAGIQVNGGSFINTSRATLTTGEVQLNAQGGIAQYLVRGGNVQILGDGLDARGTDFAAILARAVEVNASIWANDFWLLTGGNNISADGQQITPAATSSATRGAPAYALDVSAVGGMYAQKIFMVGTEAGLGVRNAGVLQATANPERPLLGAGELMITTEGLVQNSGSIQSAGNSRLQAQSVDNSGQLQSRAEVQVSTVGDLRNSGLIEGARVALASTAGDFDNRGGTIQQTSSAGLKLSAQRLSNTQGGVVGWANAGSNSAIDNLPVGTTSATPVTPTASDTNTSPDSASNGGSVSVTTPTAGTLMAAGAIRNDAGRMLVAGPVEISVGALDNTAGQLRAQTLSVQGDSYRNVAGRLDVAQAFAAQVQQFDNLKGVLRAGSVSIAASGDVQNVAGVITARDDLQLRTGALKNTEDGSLRAGRDLHISAAGVVLNDGAMTAQRNTTFVADRLVQGSKGVLGAGIDVHGQRAQSVESQAGNLTAQTHGVLRSAGMQIAAGAVSLQGRNIDLAGGQTIGAAVALIATQGDVNTSRATVATEGGLSVQAKSAFNQSLVNQGGVLSAGQLDLQVANLHNTAGGKIIQTGDAATNLTVSGALDNAGGRIVSNAQSLALQATDISNSGGVVQHAGTGDLRMRANRFSGAGGQIVSNGAVSADVSEQFDHRNATLNAVQITLGAGSIQNAGGVIQQTGTQATSIGATSALVNDGGTIASNGTTMMLRAAQVDNTQGHILHAGDGQMRLDVERYRGAGGQLQSNGALQIRAQEGFTQEGGSVVARQLDLQAATLVNRQGQVSQTGDGIARVAITGLLDNMQGTIVGGQGGSLNISLGQLSNQGGRIYADGTLSVNGQQGLSNDGGVLRAGRQLNLQTPGAITNVLGAIEVASASVPSSTDGLVLQASEIDNTDGRVANVGNGHTMLAASRIVNANSGSTVAAADSRTGFIAGNGKVRIQAATLTNGAGASLAAGDAMTLSVPDKLTNRGQITSAAGLEYAAPDAVLDNMAGHIGAAGPLRVAVRSVLNDGGLLATTQGSGGDVDIRSGALSNQAGTITSDRDLALTLTGAYRNDGTLHAGRDLRLSMDGELHNTATGVLEAVRSLQAKAADISNAQGGLMQAAEVALTATGVIRNQGEITGRTVSLDAGVVENSGAGAVTGAQVRVRAGTLNNSGAQALIGATENLALWVRDSLSNSDGATLYSAGSLQIAGSEARGADGQFTTAVSSVLNRSASIEAANHIDMAVSALVNERPGVQIQQVKTLDEQRTLGMPSWWHTDEPNQRRYAPRSTNFTAYEIYYLNPDDIISHSTLVTPDGYTVGRAVIRTHANDTAFSSARGGYDGAYGHRERLLLGEGTRVLYYLARQDGAANPDQVPGFTGGVWQGEEHVRQWDAAAPAFDNGYGNCALQCVRLVTQPGFTDPSSILIRDTQDVRGPHDWLYELRREAHTSAVEDQLAPGAGAAGRIVAGGNMRISFSQSLDNRYSEIMAGGDLQLSGSNNATLTNQATTLYRRYQFDGTRVYADGVRLAYTRPDISEEIGSVSGTLSGARSVNIQAGAIRNVDTSAGTAVNITRNVQLSSGGVPGASGALGDLKGQTAAYANGVQARTGTVAQGGFTDPASTGQPLTSGLYKEAPSLSSPVLFETRPLFAEYRQWLSSDYLLSQLGLDPAHSQKRLGDGFYEQRLVQEQMAQLTGLRLLAGAAGDDAAYAALLTAGTTAAKAFGLRVGVTLSAAQIAQLTSDIVWMEEQSVTLADGSVQQVLAPKLYLAQVGANAVRPNGALITGGDLQIEGDSIVNRGGSFGGANTQRAMLVATNDIANEGGLLRAAALGLVAGGDIHNTTLSQTQGWTQNDGKVQGTGSHNSLSNTARIQAGTQLLVLAGRDVLDTAGQMHSDGSATINAGRDIRFGALTTGSRNQASVGASSLQRSTEQVQAGQLSTGGDLRLQAGRDVQFQATQVQAGGDARLQARRDLTLSAVTTSQTSDQRNDPRGSSFFQTRSATQVHSADVQAGGTLQLVAGQDVNVIASNATSGVNAATGTNSTLQVSAGRDVRLDTMDARRESEDYSHGTSRRAFSKKATTTHDHEMQTTAVGASLSGGEVVVSAGRDIQVRGSSVASDAGTDLAAGRNISVEAAENTLRESHFKEVKKSGLLSSGGVGFTVGKQEHSTNQSSTRTMAVASTVGSVDGHVRILAGETYRQVGSDVVAPQGDINILARKVDIVEARETESSQFEQKFKQSGLTVALSSPVVSSLQTIQNMAQASGKTSNARMQALAGGVAALAGKDAYDAVKAGQGFTTADGKSGQMLVRDDKGNVVKNANGVEQTRDATAAEKVGGLNVSISVGSSQSQSQQKNHADSARGSSVKAGGNVSIRATGAGADSDLLVRGSNIQAGRELTLQADDQINLLAAQNTAEQTSSNQSSSGSLGVSLGTSGFGVTVAASAGRGSADGRDVTHTNSHIVAGNQVNLKSGGDTTLLGAVVAAPKIKADIGGNLSIESLQDTSQFASKQQNVSASVTIGAGGGGSFSASKSKVNSDYASVVEQSGIRAGDGGFDVNVAGNTDLKGGAITSAQTAVEEGTNRLTTGTLTTRDLQNRSNTNASSSGLSLSSDLLSRGKYAVSKAILGNAVGNDSAHESSQGRTRAVVSGGDVIVKDAVGQVAATGRDVKATVDGLNRDAQSAHQAAGRQNVDSLQSKLEAEQSIKRAAVKAVVAFTDEAYRSRFEQPPKIIKVQCPQTDCSQNPELLIRSEVSKEEIAKAAAGSIIAVNGILNDEKRGAELAYQNTLADEVTGQKPDAIYLMHIAPASNTLSELIGVAYEKVVASADYGLANFLGYTDGAELYADLLRSREGVATHSLGHSRGTLIQEAAFTILGNRSDSGVVPYVNPEMSVRGVGGAADANQYFNKAAAVQGSTRNREAITYSYFSNDPVSTSIFSGGNPGAWTVQDLWQVYETNNSMHSCYGSGAKNCTQVESPMPQGPQGTPEGNAKLIRYVGGKLVVSEWGKRE